MPRGNLSVIRVKDGRVVQSNIPTIRRANTVIQQDLRNSGTKQQDYIVASLDTIATYSVDGDSLKRNDEEVPTIGASRDE